MKLKQGVCCGVFGALVLGGGAAQGAETQATPGKGKKVTKKAVKPSARALQAQRAAEARAKAEQEARQRAEAEQARQRAAAEAEAKKQAEIEAREKPLRDADALIKGGKPADPFSRWKLSFAAS